MKKKDGTKPVKEKRITIQTVFGNDKFVLLFSVIAAVIFWFVIYQEQKPNSNVTVSNVPVTINYENSVAQDLGLEIIGQMQSTVDVTVTGKKYKVTRLNADNFRAQVSLATVTKPGEYTLPIDVIRSESDPEYAVLSKTPTEVTLRFDKIVTKQLPIVVIAPNLKAAEGYLMEEPYAELDYVTVKGPQADVDKIERCVVTIDTEKELSESLHTNGNISFLDRNGAKVESEFFEMESETVSITIPIYKTKALPLVVSFINEPKGFPKEKLKYTMSRSSILVASPSETIDNIDHIAIGPIDFRTIDIGSEVSLEVVLNAGFKNVENITEVTVTFPSYGLASKSFDVSNFVTENVPAGYEVNVLSNRLRNVKIVGDAGILETLTADDLVGTIDLSQYTISKGQYNVAVRVYVQGRQLAWAVGEYTVDIEAKTKTTQ